jgi:hypothetical protein
MDEEGIEILGYILHGWRGWCKISALLREPFKQWNSTAKQETFLRECEKKARRALRAQRQNYIVNECLTETARHKVADAARVAQTPLNNTARVPISDRVDKLLEKYEGRGEDTIHANRPQNQGLNSLQSLEALYSFTNQHQSIEQVSLLDLIVLAGSVQQSLNANAYLVDEHLTEKHYISTGIDADPLFASLYSPPQKQQDVPASKDDSLFEGKENLSQLQLEDLAAIQDIDLSTGRNPNPMSLVDSIAHAAKSNLQKMKHEVHKSLIDERGSHIHLANYKEFIAKKKRQRIQCQRDLREHCCTCRGPHISKPPFSHGKDYRREPTHEHCQNEKCSFIKKKKRELDWLEETIGKYNTNEERFEREILKCEDETEKRKTCLKDALANSLRLMEMAN